MRIVVIGAGSLGCVYGGNLARIGEEVAFLDLRKDHVDRINDAGLEVDGLTGRFVVAARAAVLPRDLPSADAVLVCVNAYSTVEAAAAAKSILKPDGYCLTLQNGMGNVEVLKETLGDGRVLAGLSFQSGDLQGPGKVRHTNNGPTYIGELDRKKTARLEHLCGLFTQGGLNPEPVDDIVATIWAKFIHNCGINAICALTGLRPGQIQEVPELDEFQTRVIEETVALVRAKGVPLVEADPLRAIKEYCSHKFHRPSMMQHLGRGQQTEVDALNGYVARESRRMGIAAPGNDALTRMMKGREHKPQQTENES